MSVASVIIIHFRHDALTDEVLRSLDRHQAQSPTEVIVVDNASPSAYKLPALQNLSKVRIVRLDPGLGFGGACQAGIQAASPENSALPCIILNNDISFDDDLVGGLVASLGDHPRAGIVAPRIVFPDDRFQLSWGEHPDLASEAKERTRQKQMHEGKGALYEERERQSKTARLVDWVSGAAFIISHEALTALGGLESGYFFYFEDCDWCRRTEQAGKEVWYDPRVTIRHALGASSPKRDRSPQALRFYRSRELGHLLYYARFNSELQFQALRAILALKALKLKDFAFSKELLSRTRRNLLEKGASLGLNLRQ